ncbi:ABC transporter permease [Desulfobotulus sp. H1]|uniref:ABC transporter permease n=1 Tax=Desulfobotulus pelophilus TaxID=2823377 RepID=A0ABT3NBM9_9BACT|nr:ABC transporter permease [Desulfobotulus pelophilus]MCW7754871.1 ABC transporter permease [Desulfobotulus pelophilus]
MIEGIFVEGLIYGIMALGVFFTFRILNFPDLTVDGSFPLGAAVMAACLAGGAGIVWGLSLAVIAGWLAGAVTAVIHNRLKVPHLLAGILTMTMLYSINIRIMGNRANLPLVRTDTLFSMVTGVFPGLDPSWVLLIFFLLLVLLIKLLLDLFFLTDMGLIFGALGNNEQMVVSAGVNPATYKVIGVGISNALVALSGALVAQYQGFADVNLGLGMVVFGLAAVMIGEFLIPSNRIWVLTLRVLLGAILYKAILYLGRYYGYAIHMTPNDLKLISGLLIIAALMLTRRGQKGGKGLFS